MQRFLKNRSVCGCERDWYDYIIATYFSESSGSISENLALFLPLSLFFFYLYIYTHTHVHLVFLFISFVYERIMGQMIIYCTAIQSHIIKFETLNEIYSAWGWWGGKRQREGGRGNIRFLGNPLLLSPSSLFICPVFYFAVVLVGSDEKRSRLFDAKCGMHINW